MTKIAILGAGSWGSAVALHLADKNHQVMLWGHKPKHIQTLQHDRENKQYLAGYPFPDNIVATDDLKQCLTECQTIIIAVPSHAFSKLFSQIDKLQLKPSQGLCWITKGIEPGSNTLLSEVVQKSWGENYPVTILSGPSFAKEVAAQLPTAITLATNDKGYGEKMQHLFHSNSFRVYLSQDIIGVQLCGAIKNVIAIATGISDGLNYGANARAALITRGLVEMSRLGIKLGANATTFNGLAGLGDLVLTCTDNQSRNRRFGLLIGQGKSANDAEKEIQQVVEGKHNAQQVCELAGSHSIELPICHVIYQILNNKITAEQAVKQLMSRPPKAEH